MAELLLEETDLKDTHRVQIGKIMRSGEILLEMVGMVLVRPSPFVFLSPPPTHAGSTL